MTATTENDEVSRLRVPPHSAEAEQSVLGGLLLEPEAFDRISGILSVEAFYAGPHRAIFRAISDLTQAGGVADVITVFERLESAGQAADAGGLQYLNDLAQSVPSAANIRRHAEIVRDKWTLRQCIAAADEIATAAFDGGQAADVLNRAAEAFGRLERTGMRVMPKRLDALLLGAMDRYTELADGKRKSGIPTRWGVLDSFLGGGLRPGKVYGLAARPSVGKSSVARSIGVRIARHGDSVLILSQEMPQDEVTDCVLSEVGRIHNEALQTGEFKDDEWSRLAEAIDIGKGMPLYLDEQGSLTIHDIRAKARSIKGLRVLMVDYLQLCASTLKGKSTNDEVAEISKGLKALSLELRIPIVVLSQLNRDVEKRTGGEPTLADFRDSGAIEQDVDVAVLMWTLEEGDTDRVVGIKVAKNRGGKKGRFAMRFVPSIYEWTDCAWPAAHGATPAQKGRKL